MSKFNALGIMVLFGAPRPLDNFAGKALSAAREMLAILEQFNAERAAANKPSIEVGIGIATGKVIAGYTGTTDRATYTCVGDKVNFAARLEAHTKATDCSILIDEATKTKSGATAEAISVGSVALKGIADPVEIFSVKL